MQRTKTMKTSTRTSTKPSISTKITALLIPATLAVFFLLPAGCGLSPSSPDDSRTTPSTTEETPSGQRAAVKIASLREGKITRDVTAYGTVLPAPGMVKRESLPYECRIKALYVADGQKVEDKEALIDVEPSPKAGLMLELARSKAELAEKNLSQVKNRFALKLATNQEVLKAEESFKGASIELDSLEKMGIAKERTIRAREAGIVSRIFAERGTIVPAAGPLVELISGKAAEARLGVEPEDVNLIEIGDPVEIVSVNRPSLEPATGRVRAVSPSVNALSRLFDVFVGLPPSHPFALNEYVEGKITVASRKAFLVPRSAVLPDAGRFVLFTVEGGVARKHDIIPGLKNRKEVEVSGKELAPGEQVVILGNYELEEGMTVKVEIPE